jgi:hypothetical protein
MYPANPEPGEPGEREHRINEAAADLPLSDTDARVMSTPRALGAAASEKQVRAGGGSRSASAEPPEADPSLKASGLLSSFASALGATVVAIGLARTVGLITTWTFRRFKRDETLAVEGSGGEVFVTEMRHPGDPQTAAPPRHAGEPQTAAPPPPQENPKP